MGQHKQIARSSVISASNSVVCFAKCLVLAVLLGHTFGLYHAAKAADPNPLEPLDTSSPRASLQGVIGTVDQMYAGMAQILEGYAKSDRLFPTKEEFQKQIGLLQLAPKAIRALDTSAILPVLMDTTSVERLVQLNEIFDRIELPAFTNIPDRDEMTRLGSKRWRVPGTEIEFVLIQKGPRAGEYLVSAETVDRLPEFYRKVENLPYRPGPAKQLNDVLRLLSSGRNNTIYQAFLGSPAALSGVIPPRWMLSLPDWARVPFAGVTPWQWLGLSAGFFLGTLFVIATHRLARHPAGREVDEPRPYWWALPVPVAINVAAAFFVSLLCSLLRIGGPTRVVIDFAQTVAFSVSAAWICVVGFFILGDAIVASEHLKRSSLDDQLIRLGARLIGILGAIAFLIKGANDLGFPAYSVLGGLGVGGLAVALAARDSMANLLGSLLIMLEKPFGIGHYIKVGGSEGTVEYVGFRSTRMRTLDNSLISIPNNSVVNATVENRSLRPMRRQRFFLQVTYDTSREKLEALLAGIRRLIFDHPLTNKTNFQVRFNNFAESSLDILVLFHLNVQDYGVELSEREAILLRIMDLVSETGIAFVFPTRTLQIEAATPQARSENVDSTTSGSAGELTNVTQEQNGLQPR